jgi:hypothetical protein
VHVLCVCGADPQGEPSRAPPHRPASCDRLQPGRIGRRWVGWHPAVSPVQEPCYTHRQRLACSAAPPRWPLLTGRASQLEDEATHSSAGSLQPRPAAPRKARPSTVRRPGRTAPSAVAPASPPPRSPTPTAKQPTGRAPAALPTACPERCRAARDRCSSRSASAFRNGAACRSACQVIALAPATGSP